ncbi:bile acid:sodium symporter family protein [Fictibacillus sp. KU28468]|uniref:bile acid:sodium symporter family protein n=1 Tax=Fictibacillus sp. KU28468 TaxID=2991053 RepID=UPI00223D782D|nr:bile acid:sodium symporter family protein [Fictibacillus sp. KU28468]UZJ79627.1 bile acid:sodium symporter family protein [Fictibacillus sp. KU28468]
MLEKLNHQLEKFMPFITPASVILGILLTSELKGLLFLVPWIFAFMTFSGSLGSNFTHLRNTLSRPVPILTALIILHIIMPIWAWGVGHIAFSSDSLTITGLVLAMVIPCGVTSSIWVSIYRGNSTLALSIILIDTLLSPIVVPYSLSLFVGETVSIDEWSMVKDLLNMIVIPSVIGMLLNHWTKGEIKNTLGKRISPVSKICMSAVVAINASVATPYLVHVNAKLLLIGLFVLLIAASGYLICWLTGMLFGWERERVVALVFSGSMRNISAGSVLALTYFSPATAVPVVVGMLFQQILASIYGHLIAKHYGRHEQLTSENNEKVPV